MRDWVIMGLVALVGCSNGGGSSSSGKQLVWVDKTGAEVGPGDNVSDPVFTLATYVDSSGAIWTLDAETGEPTNTVRKTALYSDSGCSSGQFVIPPVPRVPFLLGTDPTIYVRPDDLTLSTQAALFQKNSDGSCSSAGSNAQLVVEVSKLKTVSSPSLPFAPPLHRELR
jgi:hypothetical protein